MQNLAILTNNSNTPSLEDYIGANQSYDKNDLISKGSDFLKVLNGGADSKKNADYNAQNSVLERQNDTRDVKDYNNAQRNEPKENNAINRKDDKLQDGNSKTDNNSQKDDTTTKTEQNNDKNKTENTKDLNTDDKKTLDEVKSKPVKEQANETAQGANTQVLSSDEVIQDTVNKINNLIETSLDGQLNLEDVEALKNALEEIQTKIDNNEIVVSEETKQMLNDVLDRLLTQNPDDLAASELEKDLRQLAKDISANSFKLNSQLKLEEENANPQKALELNIKDVETPKETTKKETQSDKTIQKTDNSQSAVSASQEIKETKNAQNDTKIDIEQSMLDEMNVRIDEVSSSQTSTGSNNQSFTTAQDEVIKLQIENVDSDSSAPVTFAFDKTIKPANNTNSQIRMEGLTKELNASDILNQIGSKFEQLKDGSGTKITMTLRPNDLGRVTIELLSNANGITTNIIAQNSHVKELLDKNLDALKQQLVSQGINVQNVQIKTVEQNSQANLNNSYQNSEGQNRGEEQNQNNSQNPNKQNREQREQNFKFNQSNVIENVDFENSSQNATASINTLRGKISYNL